MDFNENLQLYSAHVSTDVNEKQEKHLENKVKELHSNVRHITQLGMTWFAFLVTINYLTIGWLAKEPGSNSINQPIIWLVASVFIVQNGLGVVGVWMVKRTASAGNAQIRAYEDMLLKSEDTSTITVLNHTSVPFTLYIYICWFLMTVLFSLVIAWAGIWCYYSK